MRGRAYESVKECPPEKTPQNQLFLTTFYFVKKEHKKWSIFHFFCLCKGRERVRNQSGGEIIKLVVFFAHRKSRVVEEQRAGRMGSWPVHFLTW